MTFKAGQRLSASQLNDQVMLTYTSDIVTDSATVSSATYTQIGNVCGVAFVAPASGKVRIDYAASISSATGGNSAFGQIEIKNGSVIGSGGTVMAAGDSNGGPPLRNDNLSDTGSASHHIRSGLVAGDTYNVQLKFRGSGAVNCEVNRRQVTVTQLSG